MSSQCIRQVRKTAHTLDFPINYWEQLTSVSNHLFPGLWCCEIHLLLPIIACVTCIPICDRSFALFRPGRAHTLLAADTDLLPDNGSQSTLGRQLLIQRRCCSYSFGCGKGLRTKRIFPILLVYE